MNTVNLAKKINYKKLFQRYRFFAGELLFLAHPVYHDNIEMFYLCGKLVGVCHRSCQPMAEICSERISSTFFDVSMQPMTYL